MKSKEEIAEILHNAYEEYSKRTGWKTQERCKVKFKDLPKENKEVMLLIATIVQSMIIHEVHMATLLNKSEKFDSDYGYNY